MRFFYLLSIGFFISCQSQSNNYYIGKWKLDSSSGPNGKLFPSDFSHIEFKNDGTFHYEWFDTDVGGQRNGKYHLKDSAKLKILELSSDNGYSDNYIILESDKNRLKTSEKESYKAGDSTITFNRINVFKREE